MSGGRGDNAILKQFFQAKKALVAKRGCTEMGYDDAEDGASDDNWRNDLKVITFPAAVAPPLPKKGRGSNVKVSHGSLLLFVSRSYVSTIRKSKRDRRASRAVNTSFNREALL